MHLHTVQALPPQFEQAFLQLGTQRKGKTVRASTDRRRAQGGGRAFNNDLANRTLMLLVYFRLYLTQEFMTFRFKAANKSVICRNIQLMRAVIEAVLPTPERARRHIFLLAKAEHEHRQKRIGSIDEFREAYSELSFIIDGVEQPKCKPKRRSDYSGKKQRHTRKQLVTATPNGIIVDQSPSVGGRTHDFQAMKKTRRVQGVCRPARQSVWGQRFSRDGRDGPAYGSPPHSTSASESSVEPRAKEAQSSAGEYTSEDRAYDLTTEEVPARRRSVSQSR
jgi:DDE superfamily endonuclease